MFYKYQYIFTKHSANKFILSVYIVSCLGYEIIPQKSIHKRMVAATFPAKLLVGNSTRALKANSAQLRDISTRADSA